MYYFKSSWLPQVRWCLQRSESNLKQNQLLNWSSSVYDSAFYKYWMEYLPNKEIILERDLECCSTPFSIFPQLAFLYINLMRIVIWLGSTWWIRTQRVRNERYGHFTINIVLQYKQHQVHSNESIRIRCLRPRIEKKAWSGERTKTKVNWIELLDEHAPTT